MTMYSMSGFSVSDGFSKTFVNPAMLEFDVDQGFESFYFSVDYSVYLDGFNGPSIGLLRPETASGISDIQVNGRSADSLIPSLVQINWESNLVSKTSYVLWLDEPDLQEYSLAARYFFEIGGDRLPTTDALKMNYYDRWASSITSVGGVTVGPYAPGEAIAYLDMSGMVGTTELGTDGANLVNGSKIDDQLWGFAGNDTLIGGDGDDALNGGDGADVLKGEIGDDSLSGGIGDDTLIGGSGSDTLKGGDGADVVQGQVGNDYLIGEHGNDTLSGGDGFDDLVGQDGDDRLSGGAGQDNLSGGNGADLLFGDDGNDTLDGGNGNDQLFGGGGHDRLISGAGSDTLYGGSGSDTLAGGDNSDVYIIDGSDKIYDYGTTGYDKAQINDAAGVTVSMVGWTGVERVNGFTGNDIIDGSSQSTGLLLSGDTGNDRLTGGAAADVLIGGAGDDTLVGGAGDDLMLGSAGNDVFFGGDGNDILLIGDAGDVVQNGGNGFDRAIITDATGLAIAVGAWVGVERISGLTGSDAIDATGMASAVILVGGAGDDTLTGGDAGDTFFGGAGQDLLLGAGGADALIGAAGDDTLDGGAGNDFYLGGVGADSFAFRDGFGKDVVKDYVDGTDRLDFSGHSTVNSFADLAVSQAGGNTLLREAGHFADMITLVGVTATDLTASDFDFV